MGWLNGLGLDGGGVEHIESKEEIERDRDGEVGEGGAEKNSMGRAGDWAFKALVGGLSAATVYLTATFSVNVYRGYSWHKAQTKMERTDASDQTA